MTSNTGSPVPSWRSMYAEALDKKILVSDEVRQKRIDACTKCENLTEGKFCKLCNCYVPFKSYLVNAICDADKWPK